MRSKKLCGVPQASQSTRGTLCARYLDFHMRPERHNAVKVLLFFDIGGSVEHYNDEPGALWLERVTRTYPACVWLNPVPEKEWDYTHSIKMVQQLMSGRMYPLTLEGLDRAMRELVR